MSTPNHRTTPEKSPLRIGILGLDTSHPEAFTRLLNETENKWHVPGGKVVCAWPGGSEDIPLSRDRVKGFTKRLGDEFGVEMLDTPEAVAGSVDALLLAAMDAREHPGLFERVVGFGKPVFVDKPLALGVTPARAMYESAAAKGVPVFSCSALRFGPDWVGAISELGEILAADVHAPLSIESTQPGYFWYGIHGIEMFVSAMGTGFESVTIHQSPGHELLVVRWPDGRIGTVRFNLQGRHHFGGVLHSSESSRFVAGHEHPKPLYVPLVEEIMNFFQTGKPPVGAEDTVEVLRLIELANAGRQP